jgi:xanthine/uracil permease
MADSKKWYESKILWAAVVTILLGLVPLLADLFKVIIPQSIEVATAVLTFISGFLTLIFRVLFTNQPIV